MYLQHGASILGQQLLHVSDEAVRPILAQIHTAFQHSPSVAVKTRLVIYALSE